MTPFQLVRALGWAGGLVLFGALVVAPALLADEPAPSVDVCEVVYADSFDMREAVLADELDPYNAVLLGPPAYVPMVLEAFETTLSPKLFSARWLGKCLAGQIKPREV